VFVGKYSDITGVPRLLTIGGRPFSTEHKLNESKHIKPVKQKPHQVTPERSAAIKEEVDKLTAAGILRRVENPRWVTNPIAAQRRNGEWIIQVNFKDINKACQKESYFLVEEHQPLPGVRWECFLSTNMGCYQIQMAKEGEEKTAFHVGRSSYYFKRMPSGLRNTEATYNRLIRRVFEKQIGRNLRICEGYLVTQSKTKEDLLHDVEENLMQLRRINLKLSPIMCSFGIEKEGSNERPFVRQSVKFVRLLGSF
jgi:hypothetical protein